MITVSAYIKDPQTGAILCAACYQKHGVAYEMGLAYDERGMLLAGYSCDDTATGHFLPIRCIHHD